MSPKELLYIEDTLGHEKQIKAVCNEAANTLDDGELKNFVMQLATRHEQCFESFYGLLK